MRFLTGDEMAALKFAIGKGGPHGRGMLQPDFWQQFLAAGTNFTMYGIGEEAISLAWVLGD